ncbi:MAG: Zn-ribbon domain-containing OB-fold protein [Candidatus Helarchaeota archaeon]
MDDNKIEWIKCNKCGFIQYKSHLRCIKCKNNKFEKINVVGTPTLISYTILYAPPMEFRDKKSYALGIVEFENGIKALGQISSQKGLQIGMKLKPKFEKICDDLDGKEIYTYIFVPIT